MQLLQEFVLNICNETIIIDEPSITVHTVHSKNINYHNRQTNSFANLQTSILFIFFPMQIKYTFLMIIYTVEVQNGGSPHQRRDQKPIFGANV